MKKFIFKVVGFGVFCIFIDILLCVLVDPFNVFHVSNYRRNGVEPNKNYIKMCHVLNNPAKFDTLLFGSSRVGAIHVEKIKSKKCYNMNYSQGLPSEHLANLKTLKKKSIIPKHVYLGVDNICLYGTEKKHESQHFRIPYEYKLRHPVKWYKRYLDVPVVMESLDTIMKFPINSDFDKAFYEYGGWFPYNVKGGKNISPKEHRFKANISKAIREIKEIVKFCKNNNIRLIVFTNPMYKNMYVDAMKSGYRKFLEELAKTTDYYNFSSLNDITIDPANYLDNSHYKAEVGDMIIESIENGKKFDNLYDQGFGFLVNRSNVQEFLKILDKQIANAK